MEIQDTGSKDVAKAAIRMSMTSTMEEEKSLKSDYLNKSIRTVAVNFGGEFISSVMKIIERAVVASKREGVISDCHLEEGAVAGAAREALSQIMNKAIGCNVGGKIAIARYNDHVSVAVFTAIGVLHLNEVSIGMAHRAL
ncbi:MAG: HutP family protein [Clostridia bacterium]|nr:HutP family protein [Clostridia bacterium]